MNYFKRKSQQHYQYDTFPGDTFMPDKNPKRSPMAYLPAPIILIALLVLAGCSAPPVNNTTPAVLATCSADTGVCPLVIPASVRIDATPSRYSPFMSSTPGIRLTPNVSGFNPAGAEFTWNASYGHFLSWGAPNFTISSLVQPVVNHGETIYWTFTDPAPPALDQVIISVTARNTSSGQVVGSSKMTLGWEGNFTVIMQNNR